MVETERAVTVAPAAGNAGFGAALALLRAGGRRRAPVLGLIAAVAGAVLLVLASGIHLFVVESPSMGTAAPVGTLVVDAPVRLAELAPREVISFRPPTMSGVVYTHRVVRVADGRVETRGDINGASDPWRLRETDLVGRAVLLLPGVGWIVRALPVLLVGGAAVLLLTMLVSSRALRTSLRVLGAAITASTALVLLRPLMAVQILTTVGTDQGTSATVVSTGVLPVLVGGASGGPVLHLATGQVGRILLPVLANGQRQLVHTSLDLGVAGWVTAAIVCLLPLGWVLVVGLPADDPAAPDG